MNAHLIWIIPQKVTRWRLSYSERCHAVTPSRRNICNFHLLKEVGDWVKKMSTFTLHYILLYNLKLYNNI